MACMRNQRPRSSSSVHHLLPLEIMFEILSRLTLKALSQSLFVCKDWHTIIKDEAFLDLHHSRLSSRGRDDEPSFLMFWQTRICLSKFHLLKHGDSTVVHTQFDLPPKKTFKTVKLVGSANGLACLSSQPGAYEFDLDRDLETFYVCNPLTREVLKLPRATSGCKTRFIPQPSGFAYDTTSNSYKIFHSLFFRKKTVVEIFLLGGSKWKRMPDLPATLMLRDKPPVFYNGALHWEIAKCPDYSGCIAAIDVGSETFRTFKLPLVSFATATRYPISTSLCTLRDRLCVAYDSFKPEQHFDIQIWSMREYGQSMSWSKQYTIERQMLGPLKAVPFQILETSNSNGQLFLLGGEDQGYYDLESKEFQQTQIQGIFPRSNNETYDKLCAVVHLGSLVSPRRIAGKTRKTLPQ